MGPPRLSRAEKKAATREALVEAAAGVFARRGLEGASIEEICEQAGFSRGAFYSNFSDKRELFLETLDRHTGEVLARIATAFGQGATVQERTARGALVAEQAVDQDPTWCQLYYEGWVLAARDETFRRAYVQRYETMRRAIAALLQAENVGSDVEPHTGAHELAAAVLALFEGYALQRVLDPHALTEGFLARSLGALLAGSSGRAG